MRTCHACGKTFRVGKKALVLGTMRHVCLVCSEKALRVCVTITNVKCTHAHCNETAVTCAAHTLDAVQRAVASPMGPPIAALRAMIRGLGMVKGPEEDSLAEYLRGKIEGLETALVLLEGGKVS
jgi:hypothetical protein